MAIQIIWTDRRGRGYVVTSSVAADVDRRLAALCRAGQNATVYAVLDHAAAPRGEDRVQVGGTWKGDDGWTWMYDEDYLD